MPAQYEVIDARRHRLRHIFPSAAGAVTVLGRLYGFRELPISYLPDSPDFAEGTWTARRDDAGEWSVTFPNREASDGFPWRNRFNTTGHLEFIEIYRDDVLEHVGCVQKIQRDRGQVVVSGFDGFYLLKAVFERDFSTVMAPADVIQRSTVVPLPAIADDFTSFNASVWTLDGTTTQSVANGLLTCVGLASTNVNAGSMHAALALPLQSRWSIAWTVTATSSPTGALNVTFWNGGVGSHTNGQFVNDGELAQLLSDAGGSQFLHGSFELPWRVVVESDGRWVRAFINGSLVGYSPAFTLATDTVDIGPQSFGVLGDYKITHDSFVARVGTPFLLGRGADVGDKVLPGAATSYPTGGLHGRYYNDLDLQADTQRINKVLSPSRTPYFDRLDAGVSSPVQPMPGAANTNWSARWFGAVYLKQSAGNYTFKITTGPAQSAFRLWVGKTQMGDQILNFWSFAASQTTSILASGLGSSKDGWYPIILDFALDTGTPTSTINLRFTPPGAYTDPGGAALTAVDQIIPATSLSPLGCVDQRFQGTSFFDIVQKTALDFGYQFTAEPMQLESGEFPCRVAPRVRVGRDTDVVLEPDDTDTREGVTNYSTTEDATDQATSLQGTGAGNADGKGSQITAEVVDIPTMKASLFDLEGWTDAADIAFPALLQARLNSQLGLQLAPWFNVAADPRALDRLADTFPLTGALAAMRWRPGDAVKLNLPDVGLFDTVPRPIMQVTRSFGPAARTGTTAGFRQRPKGDAWMLRKLTSAALRSQRARQPQPVPLTSNQTDDNIAAGNFGSFATLPLLPGDTILQASAWVIWVSGAAPTFDLEINFSLQGSSLGGPWTIPATGSMLTINILSVAGPVANDDNRTIARLKNTGGATSGIDMQLIATVLR
jgi:PA14 domain